MGIKKKWLRDPEIKAKRDKVHKDLQKRAGNEKPQCLKTTC